MRSIAYMILGLFWCLSNDLSAQSNDCITPLSLQAHEPCTEINTTEKGFEVWVKLIAPAALNHLSIQNLSLDEYPQNELLDKVDYLLYSKDGLLAVPEISTFSKKEDTYIISNLNLKAGQIYYLALFFPEEIDARYQVCLHTQADPYFVYSKFEQQETLTLDDLFQFKIYNDQPKRKTFVNFKLYRWDKINSLVLEGVSKALYLNRGNNIYNGQLRLEDFDFVCCAPYQDYLSPNSWSFGTGKFKVILTLVDENNQILNKGNELYFSYPSKKEKNFRLTEPNKLEVLVQPTGGSSGHIGDIRIYNPTNQTAMVVIGPYIIPSQNEWQGYVLPYECIRPVAPQETFTYKIEGYCMNAEKAPVLSDASFPPLQEWLSEEDFDKRWLRELSQNRKPSFLYNSKNDGDIILKSPFTDTFFPYSLDMDNNLRQAAPILLKTLQSIVAVYDDGRVQTVTPVAKSQNKEKSAIVQHTFWKYTTALNGDDYSFTIFENMLKQQETVKTWYKQNKGKRDDFNQDIEGWWTLFDKVGERANVLKSKENNDVSAFSNVNLPVWTQAELTGSNAKFEPIQSRTPWWIAPVAVAGVGGIIAWQTLKDGCRSNYEADIFIKAPLCRNSTKGAFVAVETDCPNCDYEWSHGPIAATAQIEEAGVYEVTITDEKGCFQTESITVDWIQETPYTIEGELNFCEGKEAVLSIQTDCEDCSTFWIQNTDTLFTNTISVTADSSDTYRAFLRTVEGCEYIETIDIEPVQELVLNIVGDTVLCDGEQGTLAGITDCSDCSFAWHNKEIGDLGTQASINVAQGGAYTLTMTNTDGCSVTVEQFVQVDVVPDVGFSGNTIICGTKPATITASADLPNTTYLWSNGIQDSTLVTNEGGIYTLTVVAENGCANEVDIELEQVPAIEVEIEGNLELCLVGGSVKLDAVVSNCDVCTYEWTNGEMSADALIDELGEVCVTVMDTETNCSASTCVTVVQAPPLEFEIVGETLLCEGDSISLTVEGGAADTIDSYEWINVNDVSTILTNSSLLIVTEPGEYCVTYFNEALCGGTQCIAINNATQPIANNDITSINDTQPIELFPLGNDVGFGLTLVEVEILEETVGEITDLNDATFTFDIADDFEGEAINLSYVIMDACGQMDTALYTLLIEVEGKPAITHFELQAMTQPISFRPYLANISISIPEGNTTILRPLWIQSIGGLQLNMESSIGEAYGVKEWVNWNYQMGIFEQTTIPIHQMQIGISGVYQLPQHPSFTFEMGVGLEKLSSVYTIDLPHESIFGLLNLQYQPTFWKSLETQFYGNFYEPMKPLKGNSLYGVKAVLGF